MLYDDIKQLLENRILKIDEVIYSSESVNFNSYLVDVGEPPDDTYIHSLITVGQLDL